MKIEIDGKFLITDSNILTYIGNQEGPNNYMRICLDMQYSSTKYYDYNPLYIIWENIYEQSKYDLIKLEKCINKKLDDILGKFQ